MSAPSTRDLIDSGWRDVLSWLPRDIDDLAVSTGAIRKRREIRSGTELLRLAFAYGVLDLSLRSVAAWARTQRVADMSDVAVYKRLASSGPFLQALLGRLLGVRVNVPPAMKLPWRIRLIDATTISHPGSAGADWRVHATFDAARGTFDAIEVTDAKGGEHLDRAHPKAGDLILADRGYAHAERIVEARAEGAHVLVRVGHSAVPMWTPAGERFDGLAHARQKRAKAGRPKRVEEVAVRVRGKDDATCDARLIVVRKSDEATRRERERIRREASRKGKEPTARTLAAAAFTFLLTTVPVAEADAVSLAELYRVRWQVELGFKRWKSLLHLDALRAKDPDLARAYILAKLIAALLADTISRAARAFPPWGVPLQPGPERLALVPLGG